MPSCVFLIAHYGTHKSVYLGVIGVSVESTPKKLSITKCGVFFFLASITLKLDKIVIQLHYHNHTTHTYIHRCIHVYVRPYIQTYILTIQRYLHTCIHTYIHTYICVYIPAYIHTYIAIYIHVYILIYVGIHRSGVEEQVKQTQQLPDQ